MTSNSLLRKALDKAEARDTALKWSLLERVNDCVKELQLRCTSERTNALNNDESTNSFLWVLEAVFIHGLNNSFLKSSVSSISSPFSSLLSSFTGGGAHSSSGAHHSSSTAVPNPSFWEFVLVFLHRDIIDQINSLHLIHTDVGRCRAWLRISLNEGLLQSFLDNMTSKSNRRCLKAFYRSSAFLRDTEKCDILKNYLMGIELLDFRLVINNSFLNHWNSGPLSLVGLWVDENEAVQEGVDIAQNLESNKEFQAIPKIQQRQTNSQTPPRFYSELDSVLRRQQPPSLQPLLSEDDALRIILSSSPRRSSQPQPPSPQQSVHSVSSSVSSTKKPKRTSAPSQKSSSKAETTEDLPDIAEEAKDTDSTSQPLKVPAGVDLLSSPAIGSSIGVVSQDSAQLKIELESTEKISSNQKPAQNELDFVGPPGTLVIPSLSPPKVMSSSPANTELTPKNLSTSISSIELESPVENDGGSYTDMLLKYQQRNHNQPPNKPESSAQNFYVSPDNNNKTGEEISSGADLAMSSYGSSSGGEGRRSRKNSTSGSMNTTTTSGVSSKSSKFTRRKISTLLSQTIEDRLELLRLPHETKEQVIELLPAISKFTKILANEQGLDQQNYACKLCSTSIGMIYGQARLCNFTGALYCSTCHINQEKVIPSRILLNWDFGLYSVSKQAYDFLEDLKEEPIFDLQEINPLLYNEIDECAQAKVLRTKLFYIGMYLKTCKNTKALEELKKEIHPVGRDYLLESIHVYTLSDLLAIPNRSLTSALTKLVASGSGHILSCTICREKGFICEVCRKPQVIFPFELERIHKCGECGAVYHNTCMNYGKQCPRCQRWKKHESNRNDDELNCDADVSQEAE